MSGKVCFGNQLNLGGLIRELKALERGFRGRDPEILFEVGYICPSGLGSYRGYYEDLAIHYEDEAWIKHRAFRESLEAIVGSIIHGYKGGEYRVTLETPVWVANPGATGGTVVTGVYDDGYYARIKTEIEDD
jgi:hypothetical protein